MANRQAGIRDFIISKANPIAWSKGGWMLAAMVGYQIFNAIWGDKDDQAESLSPSYSWEHTPNLSAAHKTPLPVIYGTAQVKPIVKNRFIEIIGEKQYLNVLYSLAAHKIDQRTVPRYAPGTTYYFGDEVITPLSADEPGKTYRCKQATNTELVFLANGTPITLFYHYSSSTYWEVGNGTANITSGDILINGKPLTDYLAGTTNKIAWETRPGLANQTIIDNFATTFSNRPANETLYINYPAYDIKAASFAIAAQTTTITWRKFTVAYRGVTYTVNSGTYQAPASSTRYMVWNPTYNNGRDLYGSSTRMPGSGFALVMVSLGSNNRIEVETNAPETADWYNLPTPITNAHNLAVYLDFPEGLFGYREVTYTGYAYLWLQYREVGTESWRPFDYQLHSEIANTRPIQGIDTAIIAKNTTERFSLRILAVNPQTPLNTDKSYEVRVAGNCVRPITLSNIAGITYGDYTYPGEALLGIRALATGELGGDLDVRVTVRRTTVPVYNGTVWVNRNAAHHAWAIYDMLANGHPDHPAFPNTTNSTTEIMAVYGAGLAANRIDYTSFATWAAYTNDTLGYSLGIIFDTLMTVWESILRICREGRGTVYPIGSVFHAIVDKTAAAESLFTVGNITRDTFTQHWPDKGRKANSIDVTYFNATNDYKRTTFAVKSKDWTADDTVNNPMSLVLYGTTNYAQAYGLARYLLNSNELLSHVITFDTDLSGLNSEVGDVIYIQHDQLVGVGGLVVGYAGGILTLDREVDIQTGTTYRLYLMSSSGAITQRNVTGNKATTIIDFTAKPLSLAPKQHDAWAFGVTGALRYRVVELTTHNDGTVTINAIQYDPRIYEADYDGSPKTIGYNPGADLSNGNTTGTEPGVVDPELDEYNDATKVAVNEVVTRNRITGEYESSLSVGWKGEDGLDWGEWDVRVRDVDATDTDWTGVWEAGELYAEFAKVEHNGAVYVSLTGGNDSEPFETGAP